MFPTFIFNKRSSRILIVFIYTSICCSILAFIARNMQLPIESELLEENLSELDWRMRGPLEADDPDLIEFLRRKVLVPPSTLLYNLSTEPEYRVLRRSYGWKTIFEIIKYLFSDTKNGFFVEAGALDGEFLSNSLWLEQTLNWTGLLVEPEDLNFRDLVWKRRKAWLSHSCLSNEKFPKETVMVSTKKKKDVSIKPLVARGASFQYSYSVNTWKEYRAFYQATDFTFLTSQCFPLYSSLLALNVSVIDFLSLDLQGAELDVFDTIPLDKIFIRSFVIESGRNESDNKDLIERFNKLGFSLLAAAKGGPDYFFININDISLRERVQNPRRFEFNVSHSQYLVDPFKI